MTAVLVLVAFLSAAAQTNIPIVLPNDPSEAVITLSWLGTYRETRKLNRDLTIRADGTVLVTSDGIQGNLQGKVAPAELQQLLQFIVRDRSRG